MDKVLNESATSSFKKSPQEIVSDETTLSSIRELRAATTLKEKRYLYERRIEGKQNLSLFGGVRNLQDVQESNHGAKESCGQFKINSTKTGINIFQQSFFYL